MKVNIRIIDGGEEDWLVFQIVRLELNDDSNVVARQPLQPPYELWEDAMALAEFDASRCAGEYDYDNEHGCWCATDGDRKYRFVVEPVASLRQP
jgi:hypothetical protein